MATVVEQLAKGAHVAFIRLRSLGDCVLSTPAISLLKNHRPDLCIGVVVEPRFAAVYRDNPDIDAILKPEIGAIRKFAPRLAINFHGGTRSLLLTLASGARFRAGFEHYRYAALYNAAMPTAQRILGVERKVHTAEHLASAVFYLGVPAAEVPRAKVVAARGDRRAPYAILHALASAPDKTWPAGRFLEIARYLREHCGLDPVFIGAPSDDLSPFRPFRTFTGPLEESKTLIAGASLFLGNDSGPAHLAAALQVPVIVMYAASDPVVWAPWRANAESIVARDGIGSVEVAQLIQALDRILLKA